MESFVRFYLRLFNPKKEIQSQTCTNSEGNSHTGERTPKIDRCSFSQRPVWINWQSLWLTVSTPKPGLHLRTINKVISNRGGSSFYQREKPQSINHFQKGRLLLRPIIEQRRPGLTWSLWNWCLGVLTPTLAQAQLPQMTGSSCQPEFARNAKRVVWKIAPSGAPPEGLPTFNCYQWHIKGQVPHNQSGTGPNLWSAPRDLEEVRGCRTLLFSVLIKTGVNVQLCIW